MCVDYTFRIEAAIQTKKFSDSAERENIFSNIFIFSSILRTAECAKLLLTGTVSQTFVYELLTFAEFYFFVNGTPLNIYIRKTIIYMLGGPSSDPPITR